MTFLGLTWDHPRGYDALAEAERRVNADRAEPLIHWEKQPLEGFESAPIADLAARHDLLVLDHPHLGEAAVHDCLIPLEDLYPPETIKAWMAQSVGVTLRSYRWGGKTYAVPLDVATQVMARRADMVARPPASWAEVEELATRQPVALSIAGPHAILNLMSIAGAEGHVMRGDEMLPDDAGVAAIAQLRRLAALAPKGTETLNPIALLGKMAETREIALIPLIFGYVTYARDVAFSDTIRAPGGFGGVLGGTGIGFSRRAAPTQELLDHIAWLMEPETQTGFFPGHGGQPSARVAWQDAGVNAAHGDFYANSLATAESALLRPRFDGYIAFQSRAWDILRPALAQGADDFQTLTELRALWRAIRDKARGPLDDDRI